MENTKKFADSAQYIVISMGDEQFGIDIKYIDKDTLGERKVLLEELFDLIETSSEEKLPQTEFPK